MQHEMLLQITDKWKEQQWHGVIETGIFLKAVTVGIYIIYVKFLQNEIKNGNLKYQIQMKLRKIIEEA